MYIYMLVDLAKHFARIMAGVTLIYTTLEYAE